MCPPLPLRAAPWVAGNLQVVPCPQKAPVPTIPAWCWQKSLRQALAMPEIPVRSPAELQRSRSLHTAFRALHAFREERGRLPQPRDPVSPRPDPSQPLWPPCPSPALPSTLFPQADAEQVLELARSLGALLGPLDEDVVRAFASVSAGDLCPVASFIGALAAQEALKVSSWGQGPTVGSHTRQAGGTAQHGCPVVLGGHERAPAACLGTPRSAGCRARLGARRGARGAPLDGHGANEALLTPGHHEEAPALETVVLL